MANGIDNKAQAARAQIGFDSSDPLRPELSHMPFSAPSASGSNVASGTAFASRIETEGRPLVRTTQNSALVVGSFNTDTEAYGRPYDAMTKLDGAHLRLHSNAGTTRALLNVKPGQTTTSDGIRQRVECGIELNHLQVTPGASAFSESVAALLSTDFAKRFASTVATGARAALAPITYDSIHMVDAASAKRAAARLGALADDPAAAQKVLGEGWTLTRTSSTKNGMSAGGAISGGDAPGYESTWAFAVESKSGLRFGVQVGVSERRYAETAESNGEIRTTTIEGGRLFALAQNLIRYASAA